MRFTHTSSSRTYSAGADINGACGSVAPCWSREPPSLESPCSCARCWAILAIGEGLLILGWVAMWRPLEILLFERLENHQKSALLRRLARIPVDFEFGLTAPGQPKASAPS